MPGMDGTGPMGRGAEIGRGLGPCGRGLRRGFGAGFGRGFGFGRGYGYARTQFAEQAAQPMPLTTDIENQGFSGSLINSKEFQRDEQKKILEAELKEIELEKKEIEKRLKELK